jgi:general secretion pathway protein K
MRSRQRGVALLVALLVVAIAVILVAALLDRGELALARTRNVLRGEQAEAYALGLDAYAAQVLVATANITGPDTNASPWATPLPAQEVPGGVIAASMRDLNGCFNLHNLAPAPSSGPAAWGPGMWGQTFERLLDALHLDGTQLPTAVQDWLDPAKVHEGENFYLGQAVPYRARGGLFAHVSELRLVRGVTSEVYARLAPYVCALPPGTTINVNTATVPVLMALLPANTTTQVVAERAWNGGRANYSDLGGFANAAGVQATELPSTLIAFRSDYFLLRGDIVLDDVPFTTWSLIERGSLRVLARSRGSDEALVVATPASARSDM